MNILEELKRISVLAPHLDFADLFIIYGDKYQTDYNPYSHSDSDLYLRLKSISLKDIENYTGGSVISPYYGTYMK